jgi:phenol hydroxylase P0 protein
LIAVQVITEHRGDVTFEGGPTVEGFDTTWKFVRVIDRRPDGFVEFQFAIGDPEIFVEMIMNTDAFLEFCSMNEVTMLAPAVPAESDASDWAWTLHDAAHRRFRQS